MSFDEQEREARLDLLAACTVAGLKAADFQLAKRLNLTRPMLKKIDDWALDQQISRWDALRELIIRGLQSNANHHIDLGARARKIIDRRKLPAPQA